MGLQSYLTFKCGGVCFACNFSDIIHIEPSRDLKITPAPSFPDFMPGTVVIEGEIMPAVNASKRFGFGGEPDYEGYGCFIAAEIEKGTLYGGRYRRCAVFVDEILNSVRIDDEELFPAPAINEESFAGYVAACFLHSEETHYIIDMGKIIGE